MDTLINFLIVCSAICFALISIIFMVITSIRADMRRQRLDLIKLRAQLEAGEGDSCDKAPDFRTSIHCDLDMVDPETVRRLVKNMGDVKNVNH